ncbi:hypothetical protein GRI62_10555 [Erythrobacter arachoides]|uniref:2-hydroxyacyl-CoA dehydratase n=1 Tax=Aurantiacibacter arachoides TaxID=1850444 RepID=A0A845A0I5_9SPHN|nr:hypothetical protein [Aurantiacibacter arachoides]MXO94041.1 hypothetical protein [Aurantiacibacter arachoides]GGD44545.1 hypothetical protein GCM10011411_00250 [Aurantiacibacter arachoides]
MTQPLSRIATAGPNLPHQVLRAAGCHAGPLAFDLDRSPTRAEAFMESKFMPWAPLVLDHWLAGEYDHLDAVLFSRADDTSQRLFYYLRELQRTGRAGGPEPLIFDIAKIPRPTSIARTEAKLRDLAERLGVTGDALGAAQVPASATPPGDGPVCLVTGTPAPDERLNAAVRAAGFAAFGQTITQQWTEDAPCAPGTDPFAALSAALHALDAGPRSFADPAARMTRRIAETRAQAVIVWRIEEDEAQTWDLPAERRALEEAGVPSLVLTRRDWFARDGADGEIAAFLEGLSR